MEIDKCIIKHNSSLILKRQYGPPFREENICERRECESSFFSIKIQENKTDTKK